VRRFAFVLTLFLAAPLWAADPPTLNIPDEIKAQPGAWVVIAPDTTAKAVTYVALDGLSAFPSSELKDPRKLVVNAPAAGRFRFVAVGTLNDEQAVKAFVIVVGDAPPVPPGPGPGPGPGPDPFGGGMTAAAPAFRCLIVYESADLSKLPPAQLTAITSAAVRDYLNAHCVAGPDGKTKEWRVWDASVNTSNESATWQKVMARPRKSIPWITIGNGKAGYEGPLPPDVNSTLELLKRFGGP
jgi:hypothetical protein